MVFDDVDELPGTVGLGVVEDESVVVWLELVVLVFDEEVFTSVDGVGLTGVELGAVDVVCTPVVSGPGLVIPEPEHPARNAKTAAVPNCMCFMLGLPLSSMVWF